MIKYNKNDSFILLNILDTLDNVNACIVNLTVKQFFSRRCISLIKCISRFTVVDKCVTTFYDNSYKKISLLYIINN